MLSCWNSSQFVHISYSLLVLQIVKFFNLIPTSVWVSYVCYMQCMTFPLQSIEARHHQKGRQSGLRDLRDLLRSLDKRSPPLRGGAGSGKKRRGVGGAAIEDDGFSGLDFNVNAIYTKWSKWSRCKKKCKQVRNPRAWT